MRKRSTASSSRGRPPAQEAGDPRPGWKVKGSVPADAESIATVLSAVGVEPSRAMGQNFLVDPSVAAREAALLDVPPGSTVVEIGGGLGMLTRALIERGFQVEVFEKEPRLGAYLSVNFGEKATVHIRDALDAPLPPASAYSANLPFSTGGEILRRLVEGGMEHGVFLVQKEVAERLASPPGRRDYGRPTVLFRVDGIFRVAGDVPPTSFHPVPKVHGALIVWRRDPLDPPPSDRATLASLLDAAFEHRRKVLGGTLATGIARRFPLSPEQAASLVDESGWAPTWRRQRAEEIPPEQYVALANLLSSRTKDSPRSPSGRR